MYLFTYLVVLEDRLVGHFVTGLCAGCLGRLGGGGLGGRLNRDDVIILDDVVVDVTGASVCQYTKHFLHLINVTHRITYFLQYTILHLIQLEIFTFEVN